MHSIQSHLIVTLLLLFGCSGSLALKGSVLLDSLNFDKILNRFSFSLIKFDIQYPYGEKHEIFGHVAENLKNNHEILVGEVNVQDFGEMENKDLADRFQLNKNDFPAVMLFRQDDFSRPIRFDPKETFTIDKIKQFVK